jgi:hydroxymethylglutaryl-CoA lyase
VLQCSVSVYSAGSETFSHRNSNCSVAQSLERAERIAAAAKAYQRPIRLRGYVSTALGCPYKGPVDPSRVVPVVKTLLAMGCYEVALADTIGAGSAGTTALLGPRPEEAVLAEEAQPHPVYFGPLLSD